MPKRDVSEEMMRSLREPDVQARLQERWRQLQENLTTSIGQIATAMNLTEARLRNWENQGVLAPDRAPADGHQGQRRYTLSDLKKLVIIEALLQTYSLSDIATFMQKGYQRFEREIKLDFGISPGGVPPEPPLSLTRHINQTEQRYFWRFFVPQLLYYAIRLILEVPPAGDAGLFLPVYEATQPMAVPEITSPGDVAQLGKTLLGWHGRGPLFYAKLFEHGVHLDYPNRYSIIALNDLASQPLVPGAYLVAEHKMVEALATPEHRTLPATAPTLKTVQRLLRLLQESSAEWYPALQAGDGGEVYQVPDFTAPTSLGDTLLTKMMEMVVQAGGMKQDEKSRLWRFACILLPDNPSVPLHERNLVIRAQSARSPYQTGVTTLKPIPQTGISLSQRAMHTGHIVYRSTITLEDTAIVGRKTEEPIHSAIAIPIEGEESHVLGVLYIVSDEPGAFSEDDQRLLRVMGKMIGEMILTYRARWLPSETLREMIRIPQVVERTLEDFPPENAFIAQLEGLLEKIHSGEKPLEQLSFIAIDIDRHTGVAYKFGDWAARNLVWEVGHDIKELFHVHSRKPGNLQLYRVYADRFYILMRAFLNP